jgi:hypothetical protein
VGALIHRGAILDNGTYTSTDTSKGGIVQPIPENPSYPIPEPTPQPSSNRNPKAGVDEDSQKQPFNSAALNW